MITLKEIKDYIKGLDTEIEHAYSIQTVPKNVKTICVYSRNGDEFKQAIGSPSSYQNKRITVLVQWNSNPEESEVKSYQIAQSLRSVTSINGTNVYAIVNNPHMIGLNKFNIYEGVFDAELIIKEEI